MEVLKMDQHKVNILEVTAWLAFFSQFVSEHLTGISAIFTIGLSGTGMILNFIKIRKETKK